MEITYKRINAELAGRFKDYILPIVAQNPDFEQYMFYAMLDEGHLAGLLVADPRKIGPEILSIGLSPEYQGKGLARELLSYTLEDMVTMYDGSDGMTTNYFGATILADAETASRVSGIFLQCGFKLGGDGTFYETTVGKIKENDSLQNPSMIKYVTGPEGKKHFRPLSEVTTQELYTFGNHLADKDIIPEIVREELDEDVSFFGYEEDQIKTGILFFKENEGILQNSMLYRMKDGAVPVDLLRLLTASAVAIIQKYPDDIRMSFWAGDETTRKLILKLFPDAEPKQRMITYELPFDAEVIHSMLTEAQNEDTAL